MIWYWYDLRDNSLTMDRSDSGINRYQYDAISQLTKAELPWGDTQEYTYDPVGNRLEMKDRRGIQWYKYDDGDELLEVESTFNPEGNDMNLALRAKATVSDEAQARYKTVFTYDEAGNQVSKVGPGKLKSTYSFDSLNRMVGMDAPGSVPQINTFDSQDRRIGISGGESEGKTFLRGACGSSILNEVSAKGKITDRYLVMPNGRMVGRVETSGNKVSFYHFDALGNTIAVSDNSGKIVSTQVYEPFGASRSTPPTKDMFGFVGEHGVESADGELMRMGAREYDSGTGRFISVDMLRKYGVSMVGGNKRLHLYGYASNNPVGVIDPFGLSGNAPGVSAGIAESCKGDAHCMAAKSQLLQGVNVQENLAYLGLSGGADSGQIINASAPLQWSEANTGQGSPRSGASGNACTGVPDSFPLLFNFHDACVGHDKCYDTKGMPKSSCDLQFVANMVESCGGNPACKSVAGYYYLGVVVFGDGRYKDAQKAACTK